MRWIALSITLLAVAVFVVGWRATEHHSKPNNLFSNATR